MAGMECWMESVRSLHEIRDRLFTGVLSDILDSMGRPGQTGSAGLMQVVAGAKSVGRAQTARAVPVTTPLGEPYALLLAAIAATGPGRVLVIGAPETCTSALFGGLLATAVTAAGGEGAVVDGFARDAAEIRQTGLPTAVRGFRPLDSFARDEVVEISGPVMIAGVLVHQNDLVFADEDGIVFIPSDIEAAVIEDALTQVDKESGMRADLELGMPATTAFAKYGVL